MLSLSKDILPQWQVSGERGEKRYQRSELTQTWSGGSTQKVGELLSIWVDDKDWH